MSALCFVVECYDRNAPLAFTVEYAEGRTEVVWKFGADVEKLNVG